MAINTKEYTFIGADYLEIAQAYFSAIAAYPNITGGGVTVSSSDCYETFTVVDGNYTYTFVLHALTNNSVMYVSPGRETSSTRRNINQYSYSIVKDCIGGNSRKYSHARFFYDENDKFIGASGLYAENFKSPFWFAIFHCENDPDKPVWIDFNNNGGHSLWNMKLSPPSVIQNTYLYHESTMDINNETSDTVYIEEQTVTGQTYSNNHIPDVYCIYNNTLYDQYKTSNGFLFINTEVGQFMRLRNDTWFKISNVGEHTTVIFNG